MADDRVSVAAWVVVTILALAGVPGAGQGPSLRVISASPAGELGTLADADQVRIIFSEPMVPIGTVPSGTPPAWISITPAARGSFYWSGTKTLIFSPDAAAPLPYATRFTVRVATRLGSGRHEFSYLVRATTAGTFHAPGARLEAMYAPELEGRSQATTVTVK